MATAYRTYESSLPPDRGATTLGLARGLGWFSIGLGLVEVLAPERLGRALGMEEHVTLIRAYGVRELATGAAILAEADSTPWIWGRVAGDALDLCTLAYGLRGDNPQKGNVCAAVAAVAGVTLLDILCAQSLTDEHSRSRHGPIRKQIEDYSRRSGMPRPPSAMRGAASDFEGPPDRRTPEALRPYPTV